MDQALIVWITVVVISGLAVAIGVYALLSAEPPTLELSETEADREQMPPEAPSLASQTTDSITSRSREPVPGNHLSS